MIEINLVLLEILLSNRTGTDGKSRISYWNYVVSWEDIVTVRFS
ncbi:MAG: hypothetical protein ACFFHD_13825 [Promethearchaeota archaeon]